MPALGSTGIGSNGFAGGGHHGAFAKLRCRCDDDLGKNDVVISLSVIMKLHGGARLYKSANNVLLVPETIGVNHVQWIQPLPEESMLYQRPQSTLDDAGSAEGSISCDADVQDNVPSVSELLAIG